VGLSLLPDTSHWRLPATGPTRPSVLDTLLTFTQFQVVVTSDRRIAQRLDAHGQEGEKGHTLDTAACPLDERVGRHCSSFAPHFEQNAGLDNGF